MFVLLVNIHWVQEGVFWLEDTYSHTAHTIELVSCTGYMSLGILTVTLWSRPLVAPFYKWRNRDGDFSSSRRFQVTNVSHLSPPSISHFLKNQNGGSHDTPWSEQCSLENVARLLRVIPQVMGPVALGGMWIGLAWLSFETWWARIKEIDMLWYCYDISLCESHTHTWITHTHTHESHTWITYPLQKFRSYSEYNSHISRGL